MLLELSEGGLLNLRGNLYSIGEIREGRDLSLGAWDASFGRSC